MDVAAAEATVVTVPAMKSTANRKRIIEAVVLSLVLLLVWVVFAIPTIIYAFPLINSGSGNDLATNVSYLCLDYPKDEWNSVNPCENVSNGFPGGVEVVCAEGFYLDDISSHPVCIPLCERWLTLATEDIVYAVSLIIAMISSAVLLLLLWPQKDTILVFPTHYLVYICINVEVLAPFLIVGVLAKTEVFCSSKSFIESNERSTPFCTVSGIVRVYGLIQITLLIAFHALGLCWAILFPFHYRTFKMAGRIKYIHVTSVVLSLVLPAIPPLLHLIDGYVIGAGSLEACAGRNRIVTYFAITLPISILMAIASSALVLIFWKILKEFILKQLHRVTPKGYVRKAQAKILVIMVYYVVMGSVALSAYAYFTVTNDDYFEAYTTYFDCQSVGVVPDRDCGEPPAIQSSALYRLATAALFLQGLLPTVILIFVVSCSNTRFGKEKQTRVKL